VQLIVLFDAEAGSSNRNAEAVNKAAWKLSRVLDEDVQPALNWRQAGPTSFNIDGANLSQIQQILLEDASPTRHRTAVVSSSRHTDRNTVDMVGNSS